MSREDPDRQRRLGEALRANLRRRKARSRERAPGEESESTLPARAEDNKSQG